MKYIDRLLHSITMYRLLLYGLLIVAAVSILFGFTGTLSLDGPRLLLSAVLLVGACFGFNVLFAKLFGAAVNTESALITGLILFFLFLPPRTLSQGVILVLVGATAMASKYVLAPGKRHIFNPAAIAAVAVGLSGFMFAGWWIATDVMLPFTAILGLLILRKIHRFDMFLAFLVVGLIGIFIAGQNDGRTVQSILIDSFVSWPLVFMGTIMLTEPSTTPPTRKWRVIYGGVVGALVGFPLHVGPVFMTPELALVLGNLLAYAVNLHHRVTLTLIRKEEMAPTIFRFVFKPSAPLAHAAGQYAELTMPITWPDNRGNRRMFTIASSPTEQDVQFGIKMNTPPSSFKKALGELPVGGNVYTIQRAGDFVLPKNPHTKVTFIAGGIGITPFRSMLKQIIDTRQNRDSVLFYQVLSPEQIVYRDIITEATTHHGLKSVFVVTDKTPTELMSSDYEYGFITASMITKHVSDFKERTFYISGPPAMVDNYGNILRGMGVPPWHIKTDYFAGY